MVENSEISCSSCIGACCRKGQAMALNEEEARFMLSSGADLKTIFPARPDVVWAEATSSWYTSGVEPEADLASEDYQERVRDWKMYREFLGYARVLTEPDQGAYMRIEDCPFLVERENFGLRWQCGIHEDPRRPEACQTFVPGSASCISDRQFHGVDPVIEQ